MRRLLTGALLACWIACWFTACAFGGGTAAGPLVTLEYSPVWNESGWRVEVMPDGRLVADESVRSSTAGRAGRYLGPDELRELERRLAAADLDALAPRYETGTADRAFFVLKTSGASAVTRVLYDPEGVRCQAEPQRFLEVWNWIVEKADLNSRCAAAGGCIQQCPRGPG